MTLSDLLGGDLIGFDDFARPDESNMLGSVAPSGQSWILVSGTPSHNPLTNNAYTPSNTSGVADVIGLPMSRDLAGVAAEFIFSDNGQPATTVNAVLGVTPNLFSTGSVQVSLYRMTSSGGIDWQIFNYPTTVAQGAFSPDFTVEEGVIYTVTMRRVGWNTVTVRLPDDQIVSVTDPLIGSGWGSLGCLQGRSGTSPSGSVKFTTFAASRPSITKTDDGADLSLPGDAHTYLSTKAVAILGDLEIIAYLNPSKWKPAATADILSQWSLTSGRQSFHVDITTAGAIRFGISSGPATSAVLPMVDGTGAWLRITRASATGVVAFYYSTDQKSTPVETIIWNTAGTSTTAPGSITFTTDLALNIGASDTAVGASFSGLISYVAVNNGVNGEALAGVDFREQFIGYGIANEHWGISGDGWSWV